MTWAEYQIRLFALNRQKDFEKEKLNLLGSVIIGSSFLEGKDKKSMIRDLQTTLFGTGKRDKENKDRLEFFKKQREIYLANKNKK